MTPLTALLSASLAATCWWVQDESGLPGGPTWGVGMPPAGRNTVFATSDGCAECHSHSPTASALVSEIGADVSPFGLWQGTLMAHSFRDPYWRAQLAHEVATHPDRGAEIEALCMRCHAPMSSHTARLAGLDGDDLPSFEDAKADLLADDGVSCTVCHQARPEGLGQPATFSGKLDIRPGRKIFGAHDAPDPQRQMLLHSAYEPVQGAHLQQSSLCGSCHTLLTSPGHGAEFLEQATYLEWSNSVFAEEGGPAAATCQQCHMQDLGSMRIARSPGGGDYAIAKRDDVRGHAFVGGNSYMLDMLYEYSFQLDLVAPDEALLAAARATRAQLAHRTATIEISAPVQTGDQLSFDVTIENLAGHKLPSGYPSRRMCGWKSKCAADDARCSTPAPGIDWKAR